MTSISLIRIQLPLQICNCQGAIVERNKQVIQTSDFTDQP